MTESRRLAIVDGDRRLDVAAPLGATIADVLGGLRIGDGAAGVPVLDGYAADPATPVADLADGALLTIVDPGAPVASGTPRAQQDSGRAAPGLWWAQAAVGVVLVVTAWAWPEPQPWPALVLAVCAVAGLVAAALGDPGGGAGRSALAVGPAALALAAVAFALPRTAVGALHLGVLTGCLALAVVLVVAVLAAPTPARRAAWAAAAAIAVAVAGVWAVVLWLRWPAELAAAVTAGAVPLGLRALPSTLLHVPDGYFLDYARHMDVRWTVRGTVPAALPTADATAVGSLVRSAASAQVTGTVLLCAIGAAALPLAVPTGPDRAHGVVLGGQIALLVCYAVSLTLMARTPTVRGLVWVPRASALVAVLVGTRLLLAGAPEQAAGLGAAGALVAGLVAAGVVVLIGRGATSLVGSRVADLLEGLTLALCLPAGLIAGGGVEVLRSWVAA